jgi:hypothetical protein
MTRDYELDPTLTAQQRDELALVAERLERDRPVPNPVFRGNLGRRFLDTRGRRNSAPGHFRILAASYTVAGAVCLAVTAVGLAGIGPFAA